MPSRQCLRAAEAPGVGKILEKELIEPVEIRHS